MRKRKRKIRSLADLWWYSPIEIYAHYRDPQNPGLGGLDELTSAEEAWVQQGASLSYAKGSLLVSDASGNLQTLAVGTDGYALVADSSQSLGVKWASTMTGSFADNETPSGTVDGSNKTFTLANSPSPADSLMLFVNGVFQTSGEDYSLSGDTITFTVAPPSGSIIRAFYRY